MAKRRTNKREDWKLTKVFEYLKNNPYVVTGHRDLEDAVKELEENNWNVDKALEQARWFSDYCEKNNL